MALPTRRTTALVLLFLTPAFWSVNYLAARLSPGIIEPHALAFGRWILAFGLMLPFCWRELVLHSNEIKRDWRRFLILALLGMWICGAFVYEGGRTSPALNISLIYAVSPALIALVSVIWFREHLGWVQAMGALIALTGVIVVICKADPGALLRTQFTPGDLWIATAALAWTLYSLLLRHWSSAFSPFARLAVTAGFGAVVLLPMALVEAVLIAAPPLDWKSLGLVLAVAVFPGIGAYAAYSQVQAVLGAARAGLALYLGPPYAAVLAWLALGEPLHWYHLLGALLILPGIYLASRSTAGTAARANR